MSDMPTAAHFAAGTPLAAKQAVQDFGPEPPSLEALEAERQREQALSRNVRMRAVRDGGLVMLCTLGASLLATHSHDRLMAGLVVLSIGILLFMIRRSRDIARLVAASRWRDESLVGRGVSLAEWHAGVPLADWKGRKQTDQAAKAPDGL